MDYPIKTVCVVGLGYIGLPTAATLASRGVEVVGVDINPRVVEAVNAGQTYFSEPDLDMLLRAATTLRKLRATAQPEAADAFVIAVPTPFREDHSPNLDYIDLAADAIAPVLISGNVWRGCVPTCAFHRRDTPSPWMSMWRIVRSECFPGGWSAN